VKSSLPKIVTQKGLKQHSNSLDMEYIDGAGSEMEHSIARNQWRFSKTNIDR